VSSPESLPWIPSSCIDRNGADIHTAVGIDAVQPCVDVARRKAQAVRLNIAALTDRHIIGTRSTRPETRGSEPCTRGIP